MKKTFLILVMLFAVLASVFALKVCETNIQSSADVKICKVDSPSSADVIVYSCNLRSDATNSTLWYFESIKSSAEKIIFVTKTPSSADLKVYFTKNKSDAKWRNKNKQHLLL